jgi:hypothetical protein
MTTLLRRAAVLGAGLALLVAATFASAHSKPKPRVLILGTSVTGGTKSWEAKEARADGFDVRIVGGKQWASMTTAQFKQYRALIIGDHTDSGNPSRVHWAVDNAKTWGKAISGNIILAGSDPEYHASHTANAAGAQKYMAKAIAFAGAVSGHTGLYFAGAYYRSNTPVPVPVLNGLKNNGFTWENEGGDTIHIDPATRPRVKGLSDGDMSNWMTTSHEAFISWPSTFHVWAVAEDPFGNWTTSDNHIGWANWLVSTRVKK